MPNIVRKIDPGLNLGLHELSKPRDGRGRFSFQLEFAEDQIEDILSNLGNLVQNTRAKAPMRRKDFCLTRVTDPKLTHEEDKWERAMHRKWGPEGAGEFVPVCPRIQAYQYPLQDSRQDKRWGKIDLLGIGPDFLPVPIELKKRKADESPLRMLVEVAAYGFAILKVWPNLQREWYIALDLPPSPCPKHLDRLTLIGVAPEEYWKSALGRWPHTKSGRFPPEAWPRFWKLVDALGEWFDIHFVAVDGAWDETGVPDIAGARVLDLRADSTALADAR